MPLGSPTQGRELRYYLIRITRARRELAASLPSTQWGLLEAGTHVVDAEYFYLVYKPGNPARWYVTGQPRRDVPNVPVHLLLHVGFTMQAAVPGKRPSRVQKEALARGAMKLSDADDAAGIAELQRRLP